MEQETHHGRPPPDTRKCPDPNDLCERNSSSGEMLYCNFHWEEMNFDNRLPPPM